MASRLVSMVASSCLLVSVVAADQKRPDFTGTWQRVFNSIDISGQGNRDQAESLQLGPTPSPIVISQNDEVLTMREDYYPFQNTVRYALDGQGVTNQVLLSEVWKTRPA